MFDLNERLFLLAISRLRIKNAGKLCSLKALFLDMDLKEDFFINTITTMDTKKIIKVGFYRKNTIQEVRNWQSKYKERDDFYLQITKKGLLNI